MKYLLLFFITTNIYAQHFANIIPNDAGDAKMQLDCNADSTCNSVLVEWIAKEKHYKVNWSETSENSIASKIELQNEIEVTKYAVPINFSIVKVDKTAEIAEEKTQKAIKKSEVSGVKALVDKLDNYGTVGEHRETVNKILKHLLKNLKED